MISGQKSPIASHKWMIVPAAFVAVRILAYAMGLRFDASEMAAFWHFIEPALLRDRLIESVFYLHTQPPLYNLWLGTYLKVFGDALPLAFAATYLGLGVLLCVQLYALFGMLGVGGWWRAAATAVFCTSPAVLLYENFLLYSYPVAVLLTWSAARLYRAIDGNRGRDWLALAAILTIVVLMRALYHPVWLVAVFAGAGWVLWRSGRTLRPLAAAAAVALVFVGAVLVKNQVVFGRATLSSFDGMNLSRVVLDRMDDRDRRARVARGEISTWALTGGFEDLYRYEPAPEIRATGVPLLDRRYKAEGWVNLHHHAYIEVSRQLARDSLAVVADEPGLYARSVWLNLQQTLHPASTYAPLLGARVQIGPLAGVYEALLGWIPGLGPTGVWPLLLPLVLATALVRLWRERRVLDARGALTLYLVFTIGYVVTVGALMERTENQRFRFDVDAMIWLLTVAAACHLWNRLRRGHPRAAEGVQEHR